MGGSGSTISEHNRLCERRNFPNGACTEDVYKGDLDAMCQNYLCVVDIDSWTGRPISIASAGHAAEGMICSTHNDTMRCLHGKCVHTTEPWHRYPRVPEVEKNCEGLKPGRRRRSNRRR